MKQTKITTFAQVASGQKFVEALSTCDQVAWRITPRQHKGKWVNAQRAGGQMIFMASWEPVFLVDGDK